jgi:hypothetical protein
MKLRGLYAIPRNRGAEALLRAVAQALEGGIAMLQIPAQGQATPGRGKELLRGCAAIEACRSWSTTTSRSRWTAAPTVCTSAATTAIRLRPAPC